MLRNYMELRGLDVHSEQREVEEEDDRLKRRERRKREEEGSGEREERVEILDRKE